MSAVTGSSANLSSGIKHLGQVTNSYGCYITSGGAAYTLSLPFDADCIQWYNYTKYGTNSQNLQGIWFRDFPAGDALIISRGTTTLSSSLEGTNGVTDAGTSAGFTAQQQTLTNITAATPGVVTVASTAAYADGDRVTITKVVGSLGNTVNNKTFVIDVLNSTTFALYDVYGNAYTTSGTYTSGGQVTLAGPSLGVVDSPATYKYTLGTAVMANSSDVLYIVAWQFNSYYNLGSA